MELTDGKIRYIDDDMSEQQNFYDEHTNFSGRTLSEYNISPGIMAKFNTILEHIGKSKKFYRTLDVGCSGNSFIHFLKNAAHKSFCDIAHKPLTLYSQFERYHPVNGTITQMPYQDDTFDLVTGLDVLEHIPDDNAAAKEMVRVLRPSGILLVTVPHRQKYYTNQDAMVGHYRRYEYNQIQDMFLRLGLKELTKFPVYGQIMKVQLVQESNPEKTEDALNNLRSRYETDPLFKKFWDVIVKIGSIVMKWDARLQAFDKTMDICVIFKKNF